MAGSVNPQDVAERDDAHLRSLGIKPELQRSFGFLSNFAVAFSYISVATGTFTLIALGWGVGGPAFFWSWPIIILGQTFVALNFAELASHFPVAGSIYQWSKRLANRTLGWFTGWFYFWAGVVTVTAVAGTVPLVLSSIFGIDLKAASPLPFFNNLVFYALVTLIITTVINGAGARLLSIINNIGVGAEILGMLVFALILLLFFRVQDVSVLTTTAGIETPETGGYLPVFAIAMFMSLFVVYGFDTAGTFGEETIDASRQAPRGILSAIWLSGIVGAVFLLAIILATPDMTAALDGSVPDLDGRQVRARRHLRVRLPVRHPRRGLRLHPGDPGGHRATDVLDGARPAHAARLAVGHRQLDVQDPDQRCRRGRPARRHPVPHHRQPGAHRDRSDGPDLPVVLHVQPRACCSPGSVDGRAKGHGSSSVDGVSSSTSWPSSGAD